MYKNNLCFSKGLIKFEGDAHMRHSVYHIANNKISFNAIDQLAYLHHPMFNQVHFKIKFIIEQ